MSKLFSLEGERVKRSMSGKDYHSDKAIANFDTRVQIVLKCVRNEITLSPNDIAYILKAATENDNLKMPQEIAAKVGLGVFVINDKVFTRIIMNYSHVLEYFSVKYNIDLFGTKCSCVRSCPPTRCFLGKLPCTQKLHKIMLMREILPCQDVSSLIIREMMF